MMIIISCCSSYRVKNGVVCTYPILDAFQRRMDRITGLATGYRGVLYRDALTKIRI